MWKGTWYLYSRFSSSYCCLVWPEYYDDICKISVYRDKDRKHISGSEGLAGRSWLHKCGIRMKLVGQTFWKAFLLLQRLVLIHTYMGTGLLKVDHGKKKKGGEN